MIRVSWDRFIAIEICILKIGSNRDLVSPDGN